MRLPKFGCKICRKEAAVEKIDETTILVSHCGQSEKFTSKERIYGNKDNLGRLHGAQPNFGTGESYYRYGELVYLDDGNGNAYDELEDL